MYSKHSGGLPWARVKSPVTSFTGIVAMYSLFYSVKVALAYDGSFIYAGFDISPGQLVKIIRTTMTTVLTWERRVPVCFKLLPLIAPFSTLGLIELRHRHTK